VVNVASRLEGTAPVGDVAIGAETLRQVPGAQVDRIGSVSVKGRSDPVQAFVLTGLPDA
jgi:adenylate cyclase